MKDRLSGIFSLGSDQVILATVLLRYLGRSFHDSHHKTDVVGEVVGVLACEYYPVAFHNWTERLYVYDFNGGACSDIAKYA